MADAAASPECWQKFGRLKSSNIHHLYFVFESQTVNFNCLQIAGDNSVSDLTALTMKCTIFWDVTHVVWLMFTNVSEGCTVPASGMKLAVHLVYFSNLNMGAVCPSEALITIYHNMQQHSLIIHLLIIHTYTSLRPDLQRQLSASEG
jgi:hypothetical protein